MTIFCNVSKKCFALRASKHKILISKSAQRLLAHNLLQLQTRLLLLSLCFGVENKNYRCQDILNTPLILRRLTASLMAQWVKNPPTKQEKQEMWVQVPELRRSPAGGNGEPLSVFLPEKSHGQRNLVGYSPKGRKELDTTGRLITSTAQR